MIFQNFGDFVDFWGSKTVPKAFQKHSEKSVEKWCQNEPKKKTLLTWECEARFFVEVYDIEYLRISKRGHDLLTGEDLARIVRTRSKSFRKSSNIQAWARPIEWGVPGQQQQHQQQHQHQQQRAYRRYVCCRLRPARFWLIFGSTLDPFRDQFQITSW